MEISPLRGKQLESVKLATARQNLWEGSVRSSKTVSSLVAWLKYVRTGPGGNLLMTGKTERTLKRNIIDPLTEMLGPSRCKYNQGAGEVMLCGRRVYVAGANDERAQDKIKGLTLAGAMVDEVSTIPQSFYQMLLSRLSIDGAQLFGTTNPEGPAHWLKKDYLDKASVWLDHDCTVKRDPDGLDLARFSFRLADNPHLPPAYVESLRREFTGLWRKRLIEGLWVVAEGAVYDMFDEEQARRGRVPGDQAVAVLLGGLRRDQPVPRPADRPRRRPPALRRRGVAVGFPGAAPPADRRRVLREAPRVARIGPVPRLAAPRRHARDDRGRPVGGLVPGAAVPGPPPAGARPTTRSSTGSGSSPRCCRLAG